MRQQAGGDRLTQKLTFGDMDIAKLGTIFRNRIVKIQFAVFHKNSDGRYRDMFGRRGEAEQLILWLIAYCLVRRDFIPAKEDHLGAEIFIINLFPEQLMIPARRIEIHL